jgi:hypothetical protein
MCFLGKSPLAANKRCGPVMNFLCLNQLQPAGNTRKRQAWVQGGSFKYNTIAGRVNCRL